ncbi:MAG TPA: acyl-CoA dehydrogenase family protein [Conexivisphaerales archaeon]|nr:acyl-CoA dehydrogenase family protein [Conexivisphaerales archaeon]
MTPPLNHPKNPLLELSEEEAIFKETVQAFAQKAIAPQWEKADDEAAATHKPQVELAKKMGEQGLLALTCSPEFGGQGGTHTMAALAIEEISYADPSVATAVYALLNIGWPFILERHGDEALAKEVVGKVAKGDAFFGIASTESQSGSDIQGIRTRATPSGGRYFASGEKTFISGVNEVFNLPFGGGWLLVARTGGEGRSGLSTFAFLPREGGAAKNGVSWSLFNGIGRHALSTGTLALDGFELTRETLIGEEGRGYYVLMEGFNGARILVAAACLGATRWLLERGAEWIKAREIGGKKISTFEGVNFRFAELYGKYEAASMMVYRAARLFDRVYFAKDKRYEARDLNVPVAMAKMWGPEVSVEVAQEVMRWHGAISYTREHPVQRALLGLTSYVIGAEGAQNVMKHIAARDLLGKEFV